MENYSDILKESNWNAGQIKTMSTYVDGFLSSIGLPLNDDTKNYVWSIIFLQYGNKDVKTTFEKVQQIQQKAAIAVGTYFGIPPDITEKVTSIINSTMTSILQFLGIVNKKYFFAPSLANVEAIQNALTVMRSDKEFLSKIQKDVEYSKIINNPNSPNSPNMIDLNQLFGNIITAGANVASSVWGHGSNNVQTGGYQPSTPNMPTGNTGIFPPQLYDILYGAGNAVGKGAGDGATDNSTTQIITYAGVGIGVLVLLKILKIF